MHKMENLLPIGSIVILEGGNIKLMIYGRKQILVTDDDRNGQLFDYLSAPYPEGYVSQEYTYVFNHENIAEVVFKGHIDSEEEEFQKVLQKATAE
ncbi:DUF4176 domain-containing protein [Metabacillus sp. KIGAM252]|uniref:DUF4176 domain-containing protein n=1 Tax=Metabacillus flavus TaxID=2823519 RepID=A0ABS5LAD8_9BACI|nr:DUF4176 domain-containing protein [Metabacillus flavus]MBS2967596.1 DUF4176 domain-containing protein [Metabacillus flavus]